MKRSVVAHVQMGQYYNVKHAQEAHQILTYARPEIETPLTEPCQITS